MKIVSKRTFDAPAHRLWELIREPGNQPAWSAKCVSCENIGTLAVGAKFEVVYEWKGRRKNSIGEVLSFEPERRVTYRYHYQDEGKLGSVDESLELVADQANRTTLIHTVDYRNCGLPKWLLLLMGFITRFGKIKGPDPLAGLNDLLR